MGVLGGGRFLVSEVPLYATCAWAFILPLPPTMDCPVYLRQWTGLQTDRVRTGSASGTGC